MEIDTKFESTVLQCLKCMRVDMLTQRQSTRIGVPEQVSQTRSEHARNKMTIWVEHKVNRMDVRAGP